MAGGLLSMAGAALAVALTVVRVAVGVETLAAVNVGVRLGKMVAVAGAGVPVAARMAVAVEGAAGVETADARLAAGPPAVATPRAGESCAALVAVRTGVGTAIVANPRTTASRVRLGVG